MAYARKKSYNERPKTKWDYPFFYIKCIFEQITQRRRPRWDAALLQTESFIERRLFYALRAAKIPFKPQYKCGRYRIDIALPRQKIAIECDGYRWHSSKKAKARDRRKDEYLEKEGWIVFRFTGREIVFSLWKCMRTIYYAIGRKPFSLWLLIRFG